jgi:CRP/FNR family transcriptional regulator, cyclic AMP receptor protein
VTRNPLRDLLDRAHGLGNAHARDAAKTKRDYLLTMEIFRDLPPEQITMIEHATVMRTIPKGQIIYSQEDRAEALFLLKHGRVSIYRLTPTGKRLDLTTIEAKGFFGEMPLLGESLRHAFAEAAEESLLCVMSRADVERLILQQPQVALRMIEVLGNRLALTETRLEELAYRSVSARIAALLLRLSDERGGNRQAELRVTHQEIGDRIGALRETVTKILDEFQMDGLVELRRGHVRISDPVRLRWQLDE